MALIKHGEGIKNNPWANGSCIYASKEILTVLKEKDTNIYSFIFPSKLCMTWLFLSSVANLSQDVQMSGERCMILSPMCQCQVVQQMYQHFSKNCDW